MKRWGLSGMIIALASGAVLIFLVWTHWAELDQITRAEAQVIPSGRTQIIQSAEGGVIAEINVREGQRVRKGEPIVQISEVKEDYLDPQVVQRLAVGTRRQPRPGGHQRHVEGNEARDQPIDLGRHGLSSRSN